MAKTYTMEKTILFIILLCIGLFMFYPMVWMILSSLKTTDEVLGSSMTFLPSDPQWSNFPRALEAAPFLRFLWNSFFTASVIVLVQLFLSSLLA
ncbi:MAG: carbohydrate ABC transporter permease, partial [Caldibacillus sp.]